MSYAFRAAGAANVDNKVTTPVTGLPAGIQVGDLMLVHLSVTTGGTGSTAPTISTPSGWTQLGSTLANEGASAGIRGAWYYRWVDGNDTGPSWTFSTSGTLYKYAAVVVAWSGGPGAGVPVITTGNGATGSSTTTNTAPTLNIGVDSSWVVEFYSERSTTNASYTTPGGTAKRTSAFGSGGAAADLLVIDSNGNVTGSTGGHATTAGTAASWSLNAVVELPPAVATTAGAATLTLTAAATVTPAGATHGAAAATVTAAASCSPVHLSASAAVTLRGAGTVTAAPIAFRNSAALANFGTTASSFNPAGVLAGDLLVAHLTVATNGTGSTQPTLTAPAGYTLLASSSSQVATSGTVGAWYYRWATGSDTAPTIALGASFNWSLMVTAHSGGDGVSVPQIVTGIDPQNVGASHQSEQITLPASTWVVSSFGIRSTTNGSFTTPAGLTALAEIFGTGGGACSAAVFDTHAYVSGTVPGATTVADTASAYGVHATIAVPPRGAYTQTAAASVTLTGNALSVITGASHSVGWGISNNNLTAAENALGRPVDFLRDYAWVSGLMPNLTSVASKRRIVLSVKFRTANLGVIPATDITSNLYDTQIQKAINTFVALPNCPAGPHILCFEHEDDAATAQQSGTVSQLVAASQHCITMARATPGWDGLIATIITGGSGGSYGTQLTAVQRAQLFTALYDVSDVVGIDNPYINSYPGPTGDATVGPVVDYFKSAYPTMPIFIGEWGGLPGTGTQRADWITAFSTALSKARYSNVFATMYWDNGGYALNAAGYTAWAAGGNRASSNAPLGGDANITLTAAAAVTLTLLPTSADATITVTGAANVSSSTGATHPAAVLTLTAAATITGPAFPMTIGAAVTLTGNVGAPAAFTIDSAAASLDLEASATITFTEVDGEIVGAFIDLEASALGPAALGRIVPVNVRVRITSTVNALDMDISSFVSVVDIVRGRTSALETSIAACVGTLTLDDTVSTFDPDNTQSPLYGYLVPGWQSATTLHVDEYVSALGSYVDLFCGGLQSLKRTFTSGTYSESQATWVDQTFDLSKHIIAAGTVLPAELPGARIARILGTTGRTGFKWVSRSQAAVTTNIDPGQKMLAALTCDGTTSSWTYAQNAAAAEGGLLYFDAAGVLTFSSQKDRLTSTVVWTLGDSAGMTPVEADLEYEVATDNMILDAAVTLADGTTQMYGPGGASFVPSGTTFNADVTEQSQLAGWNSAAARAQYLYATQSQPRRNAPTVTLEATPVAGTWAKGGVATAYQVAVMARISDLTSVSRTPQGGGDTILAHYWIEGMHIVIAAAGQFTSTLNLSRVDSTSSGTYWRLGISRLGIDTTLTW